MGFAASAALAAPINYGDFDGNTVMYLDVTEDSGTDTPPLFGAPSISADTLDFNPVSFNSSSTGAGGVDITDGTLTFMVMAKSGYFVEQLLFTEAGDVTLAGFGNDGTFASVTAEYIIEIVEVDNVAINPIQFQASMTFTPSNGDYGLQTDGGGGPTYSGAWSGSLVTDIHAALINSQLPFSLGATKVNVTLDNTLTTLSQDGTSSFIAKKDTDGVTITEFPEPASAALLGLGAMALLPRRR